MIAVGTREAAPSTTHEQQGEVMTTTPEEPLGDDDMSTTPAGDAGLGGGDADGTDGADADGTDGDATDTTDGDASDGGDADGTDADGTDGDATDTTDGDAS